MLIWPEKLEANLCDHHALSSHATEETVVNVIHLGGTLLSFPARKHETLGLFQNAMCVLNRRIKGAQGL